MKNMCRASQPDPSSRGPMWGVWLDMSVCVESCQWVGMCMFAESCVVGSRIVIARHLMRRDMKCL